MTMQEPSKKLCKIKKQQQQQQQLFVKEYFDLIFSQSLLFSVVYFKHR